MDFDLAYPAKPAWDAARLAWQFVPLADDEGCARQGWARPPDRPGRPRVVCEGYGLSEEVRTGLPELSARRMEATASGIEALAAADVPAHQRWAEEGVPTMVRADRDWVERHSGSSGRLSSGPENHKEPPSTRRLGGWSLEAGYESVPDVPFGLVVAGQAVLQHALLKRDPPDNQAQHRGGGQ